MGLAPELVATINKSKHDENKESFPVGVPRLSDDVEGPAIYHGPKGDGYLIGSIQGLSEFAVFKRKNQKYLGSFSIYFNQNDRVTKTDGFEIPIGAEFKNGLMAVQNDENTDENGELLNANYIILSFDDVLNQLGLYSMITKGWSYNPLELSK